MNFKVKCSTALCACMAMALAAFGVAAQGADSKNRTEISAGQRALDMLEVQNTFSKHAFYHQAGKHCDEIADLWVDENGPNAKTARWTLAGTPQDGIAEIKKQYCTDHLESQKKTLTELSKKVSTVKDIPENIGAGGEYVMHTQETPVIEVASDGKTAKGLWYSIGQAVRGSVTADGKTSVTTGWMWEKYGVDFIKEDGKWKIWHLINIMDQGPVDSSAQGQGGPGGGPSGGGPGGGGPGGGGPGGPGGGDNSKHVDSFHWSPTAVLRIDPKFPEPYYTFSETFSY